ncbi:ATP-binding cassette domain-containing protein [Nocardia sp. NBC_00881]|uniref:ABC transporter ATP-binding protein n=1 Tax=Nocardia sp. NBC_00881 TaxID=2975995 RepID=UPI003862EF7C|nr:ATP-binding cassette domain-containing protein [Nocardia sp. NBC_00881]
MSDLVLVDRLTVLASNGQKLVGPATFRIPAGTVTALTGPSGSGKTTVMRALLGRLPSVTARATGTASVAGNDVFSLNHVALQRFRRMHIAYVGQDPGSALNPLLRVRALLREVAPDAAMATLVDTLALVGLSAEYLRRRPSELSGGQQRRVALARALIRDTGVLVLDEPLAGLHGALRTDIAGQLVDIARRRSAAILLSGHDTTLVHSIADQVVELGAVTDLTEAGPPRALVPSGHPEGRTAKFRDGTGTQSRIADAFVETAHASPVVTLPDRAPGVPVLLDTDSVGDRAGDHPIGTDADLVRNGRRGSLGAAVKDGFGQDEFALRAQGIGASVDGHQVLADVGFELCAGAALAVVGASGAGKTTLARVVAGLHRCATGYLELRGAPISVGRGRRISHGAGGIQLVTQNPRSALNPRRTVAQTLGRPLRRIGGVPRRRLPQHITELLASVELPADLAGRYPHELSGGQRQRIALARALAAEPAVLLCDEITSALDHTTAASIMALLDRVRADHGTALLIISHDMGLVAEHCSRLLVLDHGRVVESGDTGTVLAAPTRTATRELLG